MMLRQFTNIQEFKRIFPSYTVLTQDNLKGNFSDLDIWIYVFKSFPEISRVFVKKTYKQNFEKSRRRNLSL